MVENDEGSGSDFADTPYVPSGPRRSTFTPPSGKYPPLFSRKDASADSEETDARNGGDDAPETLAESASAGPESAPVADTVQHADVTLDAGGAPTAELPDPPRRRSLQDDELVRTVTIDVQKPDSTLNAIELLQAELQLREQEAQEFTAWEQRMRTIGTPEALESIADAIPTFTGVISIIPMPGDGDHAQPPVQGTVPTGPGGFASGPGPSISEASVPEASVPQAAVPEAAVPEAAIFEPFVPEALAPESAQPAQPEPGAVAQSSEVPTPFLEQFPPPRLEERVEVAELQGPNLSDHLVFLPPWMELTEPQAAKDPPLASESGEADTVDEAPVDTADEAADSTADQTPGVTEPRAEDSLTAEAVPDDGVIVDDHAELPAVLPTVQTPVLHELVDPNTVSPMLWAQPAAAEQAQPTPVQHSEAGSSEPEEHSPATSGEPPAESPGVRPEEPPAVALRETSLEFESEAEAPDAAIPIREPAEAADVEPAQTLSSEEPDATDTARTGQTAEADVPQEAALDAGSPPSPFDALLTGVPEADAGPAEGSAVAPESHTFPLAASAVTPPVSDAEAQPFSLLHTPLEAESSPTGSQHVIIPAVDVEPADEVDETDRAFDPLPSAFPVTSEGVVVVPAETASAPIQPVLSPRVATGEQVVVDNEPTKVPIFSIELSADEATPVELRASRAGRMFWLWFATNTSLVSVAFGAALFGLGMSLRQAILAAFIGVAISFLPLGLGTLAGKWSGQPTIVVSRATFGLSGNIVPAILALVTRLFWGAVLLWLVGVCAARMLTTASPGGMSNEVQLSYLGVIVGFALAFLVALFGYHLFARVQLVLSVLSGLIIVGLLILTTGKVDFRTALTMGDGPWILVVTGVVLVFSFIGLVWASSSGDLARYQRPSSSGAAASLWASFGATLPAFLLIAYGALLAASNPETAKGVL
ncbi:MAG: cytosine permease, partial [Lacisediminihabitans sp.]